MDKEKIVDLINMLETLQKGIDPNTKELFDDDTILNNRNIKRGFFECALILKSMIVEDPIPAKATNIKDAFSLTKNQKREFPYSSDPINISDFAKTINTFVQNSNMRKIQTKQITKWLLFKELLCEVKNDEDRVFRVANNDAKSVGITKVKKESQKGIAYTVNLYNSKAQKYIVDNIEDISKNY